MSTECRSMHILPVQKCLVLLSCIAMIQPISGYLLVALMVVAKQTPDLCSSLLQQDSTLSQGQQGTMKLLVWASHQNLIQVKPHLGARKPVKTYLLSFQPTQMNMLWASMAIRQVHQALLHNFLLFTSVFLLSNGNFHYFIETKWIVWNLLIIV